MSEYPAFLTVPGPYSYRKPIRFSVLRSETNGAVLIHEGLVNVRFRTEERAIAAALAAGRAYIDALSSPWVAVSPRRAERVRTHMGSGRR